MKAYGVHCNGSTAILHSHTGFSRPNHLCFYSAQGVFDFENTCHKQRRRAEIFVSRYVVDETGRYKLWVAKRSMSKPNWPGKLGELSRQCTLKSLHLQQVGGHEVSTGESCQHNNMIIFFLRMALNHLEKTGAGNPSSAMVHELLWSSRLHEHQATCGIWASVLRQGNRCVRLEQPRMTGALRDCFKIRMSLFPIAKLDADAGVEAETVSGAYAEADTVSYADVDADAEVNTVSYADACAEAGTVSCADACAEADTVLEAGVFCTSRPAGLCSKRGDVRILLVMPKFLLRRIPHKLPDKSHAALLDHIAAGGQPHNLSPTANIIKECEEEASIPLELARTAKPVGAVSYTTISSVGLKPDVLFTFDIQLPLGFTPKPQDGEVRGCTGAACAACDNSSCCSFLCFLLWDAQVHIHTRTHTYTHTHTSALATLLHWKPNSAGSCPVCFCKSSPALGLPGHTAAFKGLHRRLRK
eukprot:551163-Pelagomonas_calceolata.AAC.2